MCDRICPSGAIEIDEKSMLYRTQHVINMGKCTYPQCTVCMDKCPMQAIDFSRNPPVSGQRCLNGDLCWIICPQGAIEIPNMETTHFRQAAVGYDVYLKPVAEAEAKGLFRRLVPLDEIGWNNIIYDIKRTPRFSIEELEED